MSKAIQIQVPKPCHENWNGMMPQEQGRFCGSCQKVVVDFSAMTDNELVNYFSKAGEHVCGRFANDQLNKDLQPVAFKKRFSWAYVWNLLLATFLITETNAQVKPEKKKPEVQQRGIPRRLGIVSIIEKELPDTSRRVGSISIIETDQLELVHELKGVVVDNDTGEPLVGATVMINGTTGTSCDTAGNFRLPLDSNKIVELKISSIGYITKTVLLDNNTCQQNIKLTMTQAVMGEMVTMGIVAVDYKKTKKKDINEYKAPVCKKEILIYPNPVRPGENIQVKLSLPAAGDYKLELLNTTGQVMLIQPLLMKTNQQQIDLYTQSGWNAGVYWVRVSATSSKKVFTGKVILQ